MAEQALELAHYEAEMEKKKIDIEMQKKKIVKQMRFEALLEEKEVDLLAEEDDENASICERFIIKSELDPTRALQHPLPKEEQTANWVAENYQANTKRPLNDEATVFAPQSKRDIKENFRRPGNLQPNNTPPNENVAMTYGLDGTTDERVTDTPGNSQAVLLRVTTLQAMQPVKFSRNAADFPGFRRSIRDNLEDGLLSATQKIEFLPKFVSGEAYEVVERSAGCAYKDIVANLEDRYDQPTTVAAACIEKLTVGPKLGNRDFNGLLAWLLKFLQWIKWSSGKKKGESSTLEITRRISQEELEKSKREVVMLVQKRAFPQQVKDLRAGRQVKVSSNIVKLKPVIMSDGVLRVGGRISKAPISPDAMNPMILPKNHHITTILICYVHERNGHCGVEQVFALIREQFWVSGWRVDVFHPPGASHMSGVWERLVRSVKRSLKAILGKELINEEVLQTVFTEAERIANSRPLTRNSSSPDDDEPLTPSHFLNIRPTANLPPGMVDDSNKFSRKRWRQAQILANHHWKRWLTFFARTPEVAQDTQ
ncbi:hypothetical protein ACROYT_G016358 [Oculina patagonica]